LTTSLLTLTAGDAVVQVDPDVGGRLVSWCVGDLELLGGRSRVPEEYGCYPMAPWPGRLRDNRIEVGGASHAFPPTYAGWAMHGTVLGRRWRVLDADSEHVRLATGLGAGWPWPGGATLSWQLGPDSLRSELAVSTDGPAFPVELGWHPWFRRRLVRGRDLTWSADAVALLERGADHLPTGRRLDPSAVPGPYDDAFEVPDGRIELQWPGAVTMACQSDARWMVVFDELPDLVCIEPQTAPPGLSTDAQLVRPGSPKRASVTWSWDPAPA
jgi:galactose mutarotase-like enzyme